MRLSRCQVRDHINYRKNDRWPSYRFYSASQRQKSPMRYICEIFGARDFRVFQHNPPEAAVHPRSLFLRSDSKRQRATRVLNRMAFARLFP